MSNATEMLDDQWSVGSKSMHCGGGIWMKGVAVNKSGKFMKGLRKEMGMYRSVSGGLFQDRRGSWARFALVKG